MGVKSALLISLVIHASFLFAVLSFLPNLGRESSFVRINLTNIKVEETKHRAVLKKAKDHRKKPKRKVGKIKKAKRKTPQRRAAKKEKIQKDIPKPVKTVMKPSEREVKGSIQREEERPQAKDLVQEEIPEDISKDPAPPVSKYTPGSLDKERSYQDKYREENLSAIRDAVLSYLRYPPIARRMGWEGTVLVRFTLLPEGGLEEIRVERSSGYKVIDMSALEAVRKAHKDFPKPEEKVTLVIPIVYRLE